MPRPRLLSASLIALFLLSCSPSRESSVKLDPTPPISGGPGWAVVKGAYVRLKESPRQGARDLSHLRRGEVLEIAGRDLGSSGSTEDRGVWYRLKAEIGLGWAREADLDVFPTKVQALHASAGYR